MGQNFADPNGPLRLYVPPTAVRHVGTPPTVVFAVVG